MLQPKTEFNLYYEKQSKHKIRLKLMSEKIISSAKFSRDVKCKNR